MAQYRATAQGREEARRSRAQARQALGQEVAKGAAALLRQRFGVAEVWLFGSLVDVDRVHGDSDVDLAVRGLADGDYLLALGALLDLSGAFSVDLVRWESAPQRLREKIVQQGILL